MTDYYHFFGIKDRENRFLMKLVNPFAFDIKTATIKLSELFTAHGSCPSANDVTWSPWKAGKTLYQLWNVTPNKAGLIKSATPTLTLDGVNYLGTPIYLLSLPTHTKIYANSTGFLAGWEDLGGVDLTGYLSDFVPVSVGSFDPAKMTGLFINTAQEAVSWGTVRAWVEAGNIFVATHRTNVEPTLSWGWREVNPGDYVTCVAADPELYPINNKTGAFTVAGHINRWTVGTIPPGWTYRPLIQATVGGIINDMGVELTHTASGGRVICMVWYLSTYSYDFMMPGWWYPLLLLQYPMMKLAGVSAYYTE